MTASTTINIDLKEFCHHIIKIPYPFEIFTLIQTLYESFNLIRRFATDSNYLPSLIVTFYFSLSTVDQRVSISQFSGNPIANTSTFGYFSNKALNLATIVCPGLIICIRNKMIVSI